MKKIFALILVAVMCLPLFACADGGKAEDIIGKWQSLDGGLIEFFEDGTLKWEKKVLNWQYNGDTEKYCITGGDSDIYISLKLYESRRFFTIDGEHFYSSESFNMVYWGLMNEKIASLTDSKTELVPEGSYSTASGTKFVIEKLELTKHESGYSFDLYITHTDPISITQVNYEGTFSEWTSFSFSEDSGKSTGDTRCYSGGSMDIEDLQNDKNYFGILSLTVNDSECYIHIGEFLE